MTHRDGIEEDHYPNGAGNALFQRRASRHASVRRRGGGDPDAPPCAPAAAGPLPAQPAARGDAGFPRRRHALSAPQAADAGQPRRDASPARGRRLPAPLRLHHDRRRIPRHAAMGLSDPQAVRSAVHGLPADELSRPARRIVVAGARSGGGAQRSRRPPGRGQRAELRMRDAGGQGPCLRSAL